MPPKGPTTKPHPCVAWRWEGCAKNGGIFFLPVQMALLTTQNVVKKDVVKNGFCFPKKGLTFEKVKLSVVAEVSRFR